MVSTGSAKGVALVDRAEMHMEIRDLEAECNFAVAL